MVITDPSLSENRWEGADGSRMIGWCGMVNGKMVLLVFGV